MALIVPKLDDRTFQDIVDEAKKRIPHYCKEWTDHNVSDPGVTLIELFAWMTDIILYRLNRVPDRHYIEFMQMMGINLGEPTPAKVPTTFWLSAPQEIPVVIPGGTEAASTQDVGLEPIIFTTDTDFTVQVPDLKQVITRVAAAGEGKQYVDQNVRRLMSGFEGFEIFSQVPQPNDAFYLGFDNNLSHHVLGIDLDCDPAGGAGIDPTVPPYIWEASSGDRTERWHPCEVESDTTKGLNSAGRIMLHLPDMGKYTISKKSRFWVRIRVKEISAADEREGMLPYQLSPQVRQLDVQSWGGTVKATHSVRVAGEFLGRSDGSAGQKFQLEQTPILERQPGEHLIVQVEGEVPQQWTEVKDFADSKANDRHFVLDSTSGEIRLGPAVRQQDGTMKLYGAIPARGANLVFSQYRVGGGDNGNIQANVVNQLRTAIPFITRVANRKAAWGGLDPESLESAMMRAPQLLRSRERAVTESDYEFLARQARPAAIGRVKCLQPRPAEAGRVAPGQIYVLVVPRVMNPDYYLEPEQLEMNQDDARALSEYLDTRRMLTARVDVRSPAYRWVSVKAELRAAPGVPQEAVEADVLARLYKFLNPLVGGPNGNGWPFGRDLFVSDVYQSLQGIANVQFIRNVEMYAASSGGGPEGGSRAKAVESFEVVSHGVIASGIHQVEFV